MTRKVNKAVLVYQGGIANVFSVDCLNLSPFGRNARRLEQGDFRACAYLAKGLQLAGVVVATACCNEPGDIADRTWNCDYDEQPFSERFFLIGGVVGFENNDPRRI